MDYNAVKVFLYAKPNEMFDLSKVFIAIIFNCYIQKLVILLACWFSISTSPVKVSLSNIIKMYNFNLKKAYMYFSEFYFDISILFKGAGIVPIPM